MELETRECLGQMITRDYRRKRPQRINTKCVSSSSDSGEYHCVTTPWYLSASTGAWTEGGELTSSRIFLTVRFAGEQWIAPTVVPIVCLLQAFWTSYLPLTVWESLKLPLLYGISASIGNVTTLSFIHCVIWQYDANVVLCFRPQLQAWVCFHWFSDWCALTAAAATPRTPPAPATNWWTWRWTDKQFHPPTRTAALTENTIRRAGTPTTTGTPTCSRATDAGTEMQTPVGLGGGVSALWRQSRGGGGVAFKTSFFYEDMFKSLMLPVGFFFF